MLPDPKDVAKGIKHIFRSKEEKQNAIETERDLQLRQTKSRIRSYISHQREMLPRLRVIAKRALEMGDEARFRQVAKQILWTENDIVRWDRYTLTLDIMEARRDQVRASANLVHTVKLLTDSMSELAGAEQVTEMQQQLDRSLALADSMDEKIDVMMNMMDSTLAQGLPADEAALERLREALGDEIVAQAGAQRGETLEAGVQRVRDQLEPKNNAGG